MNLEKSNKWRAAVLTNVLLALATSEDLRAALVFKGALILNIHLGTERMSLDIDSNLLQDFVLAYPDREKQQTFLGEQFESCISKYFEKQEPVRYKLTGIKIVKSPPKHDHPLGWDAFSIKLNVTDNKLQHVRVLPALTIDVAAPETLTENSICEINLGGHQVKGYTLERIAGEKLRAFLSTLPAYRAKVQKPGEAVRVKDLYDLVRIHRVKLIEDEAFWEKAGSEFKLACESRYIDCEGISTFMEQWDVTMSTFSSSSTLPKDVTTDEAESVIRKIADFLSRVGVTPFSFDLKP